MSENNGGSMMGGLLVGAVVGVGLALIFTPMAGDETRRHIGEAARKLKRATMDKLDDLKDATTDGTGSVSTAVAAGKDAFHRDGHESPFAKEHV